MNFFSYIESIISVSGPLRAELTKIVHNITVAKGGVLLNEGERSSNLYFIEKGMLRGYYYKDDKEITNWFASEGEFATSFYSFISNERSFEFIQALEDCELVSISSSALQSLYNNFPETERIGRLLTEHYYLKLEDRLLGMQFKTAKERYSNLLATNDQLLQRAPLGQIASWLGITQETLSRIRADL